jgi:hypothetical protein
MDTLQGLPGAVILDDLVDLARRYYRCMGPYDERIIHLARELAHRLEQLNLLAKSIRCLSEAFFDNSVGWAEHARIQFIMELYTETFYYLAFRIETIVRGGKKSPTLPGVTGYKPVRAITIIRNSLLEHRFDDLPDVGGEAYIIHLNFGPAVLPSNIHENKLRAQLRQEGVLVHAKRLQEHMTEVLARACAALEVPDGTEEKG